MGLKCTAKEKRPRVVVRGLSRRILALPPSFFPGPFGAAGLGLHIRIAEDAERLTEPVWHRSVRGVQIAARLNQLLLQLIARGNANDRLCKRTVAQRLNERNGLWITILFKRIDHDRRKVLATTEEFLRVLQGLHIRQAKLVAKFCLPCVEQGVVGVNDQNVSLHGPSKMDKEDRSAAHRSCQ